MCSLELVPVSLFLCAFSLQFVPFVLRPHYLHVTYFSPCNCLTSCLKDVCLDLNESGADLMHGVEDVKKSLSLLHTRTHTLGIFNISYRHQVL